MILQRRASSLSLVSIVLAMECTYFIDKSTVTIDFTYGPWTVRARYAVCQLDVINHLRRWEYKKKITAKNPYLKNLYFLRWHFFNSKIKNSNFKYMCMIVQFLTNK